MLSVYVIGSTVFEYINKKYIKAEKLSIELVGVFFTFLSLNLLCKIPKVGTYIYMAEIMIAVGIIITFVSTYFAVNRYLRIKLNDMYYM